MRVEGRITQTPHKISMFRYCFAGGLYLYNNLILDWIFFSAENAFTLAEWLSVTMLLTLSPISIRLSMLSLIFSASHCPLNVTSGLAWLAREMTWTTKGVDYFNRTTINATIPLYTFPSLSTSEWYWSSTPEVH